MATISGGDKLEAALRELAAKIDKGGTLRVGFFEDQNYPDGTSLPLVAATNEFGSPSRGIPPRPFMRNTIAAKSGEWAPALAAILKQNGYDAPQALDLMGTLIAGQIEQTISEFSSVPLKPSTIKKKGFDKQLIDSGLMRGHVNHEVKET